MIIFFLIGFVFIVVHVYSFFYESCIVCVRSCDLGCNVNRALVSCILYADDIILLSASLLALQKCCMFFTRLVRSYYLNLMQTNHSVQYLEHLLLVFRCCA